MEPHIESNKAAAETRFYALAADLLSSLMDQKIIVCIAKDGDAWTVGLERPDTTEPSHEDGGA